MLRLKTFFACLAVIIALAIGALWYVDAYDLGAQLRVLILFAAIGLIVLITDIFIIHRRW